MAELGARLKEARLAKGYTIDDVQNITKIQKRYLTAIEEGNYSSMPGPFYVRAFIKQFSEAVGLNAEEILEYYKEDVPITTTEEITSSMSTSPARRKAISPSQARLREILPMVTIAILVVAIIIIVWFLYQNIASNETTKDKVNEDEVIYEEDPSKEETIEIPEEEAPADETPIVPETEQPEGTQKLEQSSVEGDTTNYSLTGTSSFTVKVVATSNSWLSIKDAAGKELVEPAGKELKAGETFEIDLRTTTSARVRVGNSTGVKVYVNNEEVTFAGASVAQNIVIQFTTTP